MNHSIHEERANAISHGVGALLSIAALILLVIEASLHGSFLHIISFSIYGAALVILYSCSTLLHSVTDPKLKDLFEILDHAAIYLLIAGTNTPYLLITVRGALGWTYVSIIWGLALIGIVFKIFYVKRFNMFSTITYMIMGWLIALAFKPLYANLPFEGFMWLIIGGLLYTLGVIFFIWRAIPYHHTIWHVFVLAGSASHFISIYCYVL